MKGLNDCGIEGWSGMLIRCATYGQADCASLSQGIGREFQCGYQDVALVGTLQDLLLRGLARAALKKVEGNPFKGITGCAPDILPDLVCFMQKGSETYAPKPEQVWRSHTTHMSRKFCADLRGVVLFDRAMFVCVGKLRVGTYGLCGRGVIYASSLGCSICALSVGCSMKSVM